MPPKQARAIVGARTSTFSDQKVSHEAQLETATKWAESNGCKIVGTFEDLGVSASVAPEDRPDLGQWLSPESADQWDCIVFSKMDRAFRSTRHCVDFARWAEEHRKLVVFAEDGLKLDYRPGAAKGVDAMLAELFVYIGSFFAQMELNRFQTRAQDMHRVLRTTDRWASGVPPLGFQTIDHPSGKGKALATDPQGKQLLHEMAAKLLNGWSFIRIAAWLNEQHLRTNMDRARIAKGKEPYENPWNVGTVIDALTSPKTQGFKMSKRAMVLDHLGQPIQLAPPTFDADTWKQIQEAAAKRRLNQRTPTNVTNPLLGIGFCGCEGCPACEGNRKDFGVIDEHCQPKSGKSGSTALSDYVHVVSCSCREPVCGASLAQQISRRKNDAGEVVAEYRSYRCGRTPLNCNGVSVNAELAEQDIAETFIAEHGDMPETRNVFVPGEDNSHELEQVNASIERLRRESDAGLILTEEDERVYLERLRHLIERRTVLEATPARKAGWIQEPTGRTYAEAWAEEPTQASGGLSQYHRDLLLEQRIKYILYHSKPYFRRHIEIPFAREREPWDIDEIQAFFAKTRTERPELGRDEIYRLWEEHVAHKSS